MGKKSSLKKIRRIAAELPIITEKKLVTTRVMGFEVKEAGIKEVDGKRVQSSQIYKKTVEAAVPINHRRRMKQVYNKFRATGVNNYIYLVKEFADKQAALQETAPQETIDADHS